ncbi:serine hydrolase domain-containing protein [Oerskovia flava]|uniref:serine hydrolase domain-containing protein n=1 Tax=Oerskovia flava TaxID=2986422 RepID=UPI00223EAA6F|nr:serine hydrolase [Oerskovia sp. JB1-3-2]
MTHDTALLDDFRRRTEEQDLGVYGVHVHREGHDPLEHRFRADDRVHVWSGSKTFTAVAIGIARGAGLLDLDDPVLDHFADHRGRVGAGVDQVTIRHLLQMTSGSPVTWFELPADAPHDVAATFLSADLVTRPGERFDYSNASTYLLGRVVERVSGEDLRDYLVPRLFDPLGIANPQWLRCPLGFSEGAKGLHLTTSELARLGRLLLQRGTWEGVSLVPADFVDAMHTDVVSTAHFSTDPESAGGYGYQVWTSTPDGAWRADGRYGQFSIVLPRQRAVVTVTAHNERNANDILRAVWDGLLPALSAPAA